MPDFDVSVTLGLGFVLASLLISLWEGFMPIRRRLADLAKHKVDLIAGLKVERELRKAVIESMFPDNTTKH